jgi:hypothetical protein
MANTGNDQPGRAQSNDSEGQPDYEAEDEAQRQSQGGVDDPSRRRGFDDRRKDEVSSPPPGDVDPNLERSGEEQGEEKIAGERGDEP